MPIVTLSSIYAKIRRLTGSDFLQLPDVAIAGDPNSVGIADYINSLTSHLEMVRMVLIRDLLNLLLYLGAITITLILELLLLPILLAPLIMGLLIFQVCRKVRRLIKREESKTF